MVETKRKSGAQGMLEDMHIRNWIKAGSPVAKSDGGGLTFTLTSSGATSWVLRYRTAGARRELTLGSYPDISLADARKLARKHRAAIDGGADPAMEKRRERANAAADWTVRQLVDDYRDKVLVGLSASTNRSYSRHLKRLVRQLGPQRVSRVEPKDMVDLIENSGLTWTEANMLRVTAAVLFKHAVGKKIIPRSPAAGISMESMLGKRPPIRKRLMMTSEELHVILNASMSRVNLLSVRVLFATAVRISEFYTARWEDVHLDAAVWHIPESKTGPAMDIPLAPAVVEWFTELRELAMESAYVVPSRVEARRKRFGGDIHINMNTIGEAIDWWLLDETPNVRRFTAHDARSTAKSHMRALGVSRDISEMCLNHKLPGVEGIYDVHTYFDERRNALERLSAFLVDCIAGRVHNVLPLRRSARA